MLETRCDGRFKYVFGPVMSRRLGRSLGVDLIPPKTCPLECVYCEAGSTTRKTCEREEFFPLGEIESELDEFLSAKPELDFITFSGCGEPTLYSRMGELIAWIKKNHPSRKICLLTNGILMGKDGMPEELAGLDLVVPSLDASDEKAFQKINRPAPGLSLDQLVSSIKNFRKRNKCPMWLEIFVVPGLNDSDSSIAKFAEIVAEIKPEKIQLNGLDRPGMEKWVQKPDPDSIAKFKSALSPLAEVEVVARTRQSAKIARPHAEIEDSIVQTLSRRPCTEQEIAGLFSLSPEQTAEIIEKLISSGKFHRSKTPAGTFISNKV